MGKGCAGHHSYMGSGGENISVLWDYHYPDLHIIFLGFQGAATKCLLELSQ
jgi:hypothetical protein